LSKQTVRNYVSASSEISFPWGLLDFPLFWLLFTSDLLHKTRGVHYLSGDAKVRWFKRAWIN